MYDYRGNASSLNIDPADYDHTGLPTVIEKTYYLGTPPSLNLSSADLPYEGCALIFYGNDVTAPQDGGPPCSDLIGESCGSSLVGQAKDIISTASATDTTEAACQMLQARLNETFTSGCSKLAGQDSWNNITAIRKSPPSLSDKIKYTNTFLSTYRLISSHYSIGLRKRILKLPSYATQIE
jgi:hypothetical protein